MRSALLVAIPVVALLGVPTTALGDPAWELPATTLSPAAPLGWPPVVVSDAAGDATAVFATASGSSAETLRSEDHPLGGVWKAPLTVPSAGNATGLVLADSPAGQTTAVWVDREGAGPYQVWSSSRAFGAAWATPVRLPLTGAASDTIGSPGLAEDARGDAVVAWTESNRQNSSTWLLASVRENGVWSAPKRLSDAGAQVYNETPARVAVDGAGEFVVAWSQFLAPGIISVDAEELIGGAWEGEQTLESGGDYLYSVALAENAAGDATAAWADLQRDTVRAATLRSGAWTLSSPPSTRLYAACETPPPQLGVDGAGDTLLAWVGEGGQVQAESLAATGTWAGAALSVSSVPDGGHASSPHLAVDQAGDQLITWTAYDPTSGMHSTQAAWRAAGGAWGAPVTLSGPEANDTSAAVSMDPRGNAVEAWAAAPSGESYEIRAAGFELAPVIEGLQLPLRTTQHQSATFTARAGSPWAAAGSDHWDFGDGSSAQGATVSHAYGSPGDYTVTLTVTDALLNQTTVTRQVSVTASPESYMGAATGAVGAPLAADSDEPAPAALTPVYIAPHHQRLWVAHASHTVSVAVHNTNAFPVIGTATMLEDPSTRQGVAPRTLAGLARFNLPAHTNGTIVFRLGRAALARLRAQAPAKGHDLVQVRLTIGGSSGQSTTALGTYALDGPSLTRALKAPAAGVRPAASAAPVEPWARDAC